MTKRRQRFIQSMASDRAIRIFAGIHIALSLILMGMTYISFAIIHSNAAIAPHSFFAAAWEFAPLALALMLIPAAGFIFLFIWKCRNCRMGPGKRIATALQKMSRGDLGWKITLRRGDGMAEVAASVTHASESLADRINKLSIQVRQLTEIENFLIDSLETEQIYNPYTMKALRKLKICTNRLNAGINDFHISSMRTTDRITISRPESPKEKSKKEDIVGV